LLRFSHKSYAKWADYPCTGKAYIPAIANGAVQQTGWPTTRAAPYVWTITENEER